MISGAHHASQHAARAHHALIREMHADADRDFWRNRARLHIAIAGRPQGHADALIRFAAMTDGNPLMPIVLRSISLGGSQATPDPVHPASPSSK